MQNRMTIGRGQKPSVSRRAAQGVLICTLSVCLIVAYIQTERERMNLSLVESVLTGDSDRAVALLKQGADPNAVVNGHETEPGARSAFHLLMRRINRIFGRSDDAQSPILVEAVRRYTGDIKIVSSLLNAGADANMRDSRGETALFVASERDDPLVALLLDRGADPGLPDLRGATPLMRSVQAAPYRGTPSIMLALIKRGAKINAQTVDGITALILAAGRKPDAVETLLRHGADVTCRDKRGHSALDVAQFENALQTVRILRRYGAKY
jgi:ankyrin repeat protein